jgi:hypothetical protein
MSEAQAKARIGSSLLAPNDSLPEVHCGDACSRKYRPAARPIRAVQIVFTSLS